MQDSTVSASNGGVKPIMQPLATDTTSAKPLISPVRPEDVQAIDTLSEVNRMLKGELPVPSISTSEVAPIEGGSEAQTAQDIKTIQIKTGDSVTEIPDNATVSVVIDGVRSEVPLKQYLNGISGEMALAKRFSALDLNRKQFEKTLRTWTTGEQKFNELLSQGQAKKALELIISHSKHSSDVVFQSLANEIAPMVDGLMKMTPQQRKEWEMQQKSETYRKQLEAAQGNLTKLQAKSEQMSKIKSVQRSYGLDDASFVQYHDALMEDIRTGHLPYKGEVTPEIVGEYVLMNTYQGWAKDALAEVAPHMTKNGRVIMEIIKEGKRLADKGYKINQSAFRELVSYIYTGKSAQPKQQPPQTPQQPQSVQKRSNQNWLQGLSADLRKASNTKEQQDVFRKWDKQ